MCNLVVLRYAGYVQSPSKELFLGSEIGMVNKSAGGCYTLSGGSFLQAKKNSFVGYCMCMHECLPSSSALCLVHLDVDERPWPGDVQYRS